MTAGSFKQDMSKFYYPHQVPASVKITSKDNGDLFEKKNSK
jgi:hypothetical protein